MRCDVHLRSFTTGMLHPRTACPLITPTFFDKQFESYFSIDVCGAYLGIFFGNLDTKATFAMWDWRSGNQTMFIEDPKFTSFTFKSDELVLVTFVDDDDGDVVYLCELRYPRLRGDVGVVRIIPASLPTSAGSGILAQIPFAHSSTDVLFTIVLHPVGLVVHQVVVLFVPRSTILNQLSSVAANPQKYLEWESWGPEGSRMLKLDRSESWSCHSYGMKAVYSPLNGTSARIFDFNPYRTRKNLNTPHSPHLPWKPLPMETKIGRRRNLFDINVVTSLQGREASIPLPPNIHG